MNVGFTGFHFKEQNVMPSTLEQARDVAFRAHKGQKYGGERPYTYHLGEVVGRVESDIEKVVAWLHDILEDTDVDYEALLHEFGVVVADAVLVLTRGKTESYIGYIERVKYNSLPRWVKIADLKSNLDSSGMMHLKPRYRTALEVLQEWDKKITCFACKDELTEKELAARKKGGNVNFCDKCAATESSNEPDSRSSPARLTHTVWDPEMYHSAVLEECDSIVALCGERVGMRTMDIDRPTCPVCAYGLKKLKALKAEVTEYKSAFSDMAKSDVDGYQVLFLHLADKEEGSDESIDES